MKYSKKKPSGMKGKKKTQNPSAQLSRRAAKVLEEFKHL